MQLSRNSKNQTGFTLIETIMYFAVAATILLVLASMFSLVLRVRSKNFAALTVEQEGAIVMLQMTQAIRNAENITAPTIGTGGATLTVNTYTAGIDPTVFSLSQGALQVKEGTNPTTRLTSSKVVVTNLSFTNLARPNTPDAISISFTLSAYNPYNRPDYSYSHTFHATATVRQP